MKRTLLLVLTLVSGVIPGVCAADKLVVVVTHPLLTERPAETITLPWSEVKRLLPSAAPDRILIRDSAGEGIPTQFTNFQPEDKKGRYDDVLFQHSFAAGEKSARFTVELAPKPIAPVPALTFARYVPERLDDFAFENDRVAHRMYGPGLDTPQAGISRMISSGIDVWTKRVGYPVVDRWYLRGHDNYHLDNGEGLDFYSVGKGRGCGGTGVWAEDRLHVSHNWKTWRVLANGPIRTVFELSYESWQAGTLSVTETKRFTVDAGSNLHRVESTFRITGANEAVVALGLGKHKDVPAAVQRSADGFLSLWEKYPKSVEGELGTAVVLAAGAFDRFVEDELNQLGLVTVKNGTPVVYFLGAGWSLGNGFRHAEAWNAYLADFAARVRAPVTVNVEVAP